MELLYSYEIIYMVALYKCVCMTSMKQEIPAFLVQVLLLDVGTICGVLWFLTSPSSRKPETCELMPVLLKTRGAFLLVRTSLHCLSPKSSWNVVLIHDYCQHISICIAWSTWELSFWHILKIDCPESCVNSHSLTNSICSHLIVSFCSTSQPSNWACYISRTSLLNVSLILNQLPSISL